MQPFLKYFAFLSGFYIVQFLFFEIIQQNHDLLSIANFQNWDAEHYSFIANNGYDKLRTAFFPLFPWLWNISELNSIVISVVNGFIFISGFAAIASFYRPRVHQLILIAATPSFIFFFLPYSESAFFAGSTLLLIAYRKNKFSLVLLGLGITAFARPTASVFIPAVIITEFLCRKDNKSAVFKSLFSVTAILLGMTAALFYQYLQTGSFLNFFEVQSEQWNNRLRIPELPFTSWAGLWITALDGTALLVSMVSGAMLFKWWKKQTFRLKFHQDKGLIFSLLYLFGIGLLILLIRGGELFSLNRFIFSTAFFVVAAFYYLRNKFSFKYLYISAGMILYWLLFNSYVHIQAFLKYTSVTLFNSLSILMMVKHTHVARASMILLFLGFIILQQLFYFLFLSGKWIA